jgi:Fur family transcriptional regulator, ferric uptake regulator
MERAETSVRVGRRTTADRSAVLLRGAGLRCTAPRLAVLDLLAEAEQPQSHAEVLARLGGRGFDRATVYRNLIDLAAAGIAERVDLGDHVWRFSLASRERRGPHFLCTDCGEMQALPEDAVRLASSARAPRSFRRREVAVQVKGRCDGCA